MKKPMSVFQMFNPAASKSVIDILAGPEELIIKRRLTNDQRDQLSKTYEDMKDGDGVVKLSKIVQEFGAKDKTTKRALSFLFESGNVRPSTKQKSLRSNNVSFAKMPSAFDDLQVDDETVALVQFLLGMSVLMNCAPADEKLKFSYLMLDMDGDGKLSRADFSSALHSCFQENGLTLACDEDTLLDSLFTSRSPNCILSIQEFHDLLDNIPDINANSLGFTKIKWMPKAAKTRTVKKNQAPEKGSTDLISDFTRLWEKRKANWILGAVYFGGMGALFAFTMWQYSQRTLVWKLFGPAVGVSRGSAALLRVNVSMLVRTPRSSACASISEYFFIRISLGIQTKVLATSASDVPEFHHLVLALLDKRLHSFRAPYQLA
jgi:Ca2+-binding EF-hand superfamily protein